MITANGIFEYETNKSGMENEVMWEITNKEKFELNTEVTFIMDNKARRFNIIQTQNQTDNSTTTSYSITNITVTNDPLSDYGSHAGYTVFKQIEVDENNKTILFKCSDEFGLPIIYVKISSNENEYASPVGSNESTKIFTPKLKEAYKIVNKVKGSFTTVTAQP